MSAEENISALPDDRVVRLFPARVRDLPPDGRELAGPSFGPSLTARMDAEVESALREPLVQITTRAAVLKHELVGSHATQAEAILDATSRAEDMIGDLLNFVRGSVGAIRVTRRRVDLKVLCERVVDAIHDRHPDSPMVFACRSRLEGQFDPDAITSILTKLVLNAIEHGAPRPAIRIELRPQGADVVLEVWNAGPPIEAEILGRLFEPFVSGGPQRPDRPRGLGLGLYLVRETVRAHGGRIDVTSGQREGTMFQVTLPRS